jgi:hypothetical protein
VDVLCDSGNQMDELHMLCTIAKVYSSAIPKVTDPIQEGTLCVEKQIIFFAVKYSYL